MKEHTHFNDVLNRQRLTTIWCRHMQMSNNFLAARRRLLLSAKVLWAGTCDPNELSRSLSCCQIFSFCCFLKYYSVDGIPIGITNLRRPTHDLWMTLKLRRRIFFCQRKYFFLKKAHQSFGGSCFFCCRENLRCFCCFRRSI